MATFHVKWAEKILSGEEVIVGKTSKYREIDHVPIPLIMESEANQGESASLLLKGEKKTPQRLF